ncbi:hypothetical protein C0995_009436 [Termitomyces sp. Mi166|nr:hypothetical protein C0995_009436 [Termitomyces sp. Mi166\
MSYDLVREGLMPPRTTIGMEISILKIVVSMATTAAAVAIMATNILDILLAIEPQRLLTDDFRESLMDNTPPPQANSPQHCPPTDNPMSFNSLGRLDAPGALGLSINDEPGSDEERPNIYWTIPLPTVTPTQESSSLLNYQEEQDRASVPQVMPGPHEESSAGGNPISHGSGSSAQGTDWQVPQHLDLITNLKIETPISIGKFLKLIQYCTRLAKISVIINEDDSSQIINSTSIVAGNLIELAITTTVQLKPLLSAFKASRLKIFHLEWDTRNSQDSIPNDPDIGIHTFLKISKCYLNTLSLVNLFPDEAQLIDCLKLQRCTNLQTLILRNNSASAFLSSSSGRTITEATLKLLSPFDGNGPQCPRLSRLEITSCCAPDGQLSSMVDARTVKKEQTFHLHYSFGEDGPSLHPIDRSTLAKLSRKRNTVIVEEPQYCISLD